MKDLILTSATSLKESQIYLFIRTLNYYYKGDVVIFTDKKYTFKGLKFNCFLINPNDGFNQGLKVKRIVNVRFYWYLKYLNENMDYDRVFLTDISDVIFQSNPFERMSEDKIYVAEEEELISKCSYNSKWMIDLYGEDILLKLGKERIICAGTTMGSYKNIVFYLQYITKELTRFKNLLVNEDIIVDQAIHNYFCYKYPELIIKTGCQNNIFLTLGYSRQFHFDKSGSLVNSENQKYSVVHQYNRYYWLSKHLQNLNDYFIFRNLKHLLFRFMKTGTSLKYN